MSLLCALIQFQLFADMSIHMTFAFIFGKRRKLKGLILGFVSATFTVNIWFTVWLDEL